MPALRKVTKGSQTVPIGAECRLSGVRVFYKTHMYAQCINPSKWLVFSYLEDVWAEDVTVGKQWALSEGAIQKGINNHICSHCPQLQWKIYNFNAIVEPSHKHIFSCQGLGGFHFCNQTWGNGKREKWRVKWLWMATVRGLRIKRDCILSKNNAWNTCPLQIFRDSVG